ncbi:hypothetical protein [uncultured Aquimarina sp.]|uniref:hypothetical protein n=1 Tax=uncultured Aquimarina sp. TaxID=575652 RepID=UPI0026349A0C|nr:hypothetical protein [uncultured Aquimarina sp.]
MPILTISEHLELYQTLKNQFVSPYTNMDVTMEILLHKRVIDTGLIQNIKKKPVIAFYTTTDRTEIPKKDWTQQMKKAAADYAKQYPIVDAGKTYSTFGKVIFSTAIIGVVGAFALVFYLFMFSNPQTKMNIEEFVSLPNKGDKYYGFINQTLDEKKTPFLAHGWIKVIAINPVDSTCTYVTSKGVGELTFDTLEADHNNFSNMEIKGKFKADKRAQKISLISSDKRWRFESQVISNKTKNYKITAQ